MAKRGPPPRTRCRQGHPLVEGNLYFRRDGGRQCRTCQLANRLKQTVRAGGRPHKWPLVHEVERQRDAALRERDLAEETLTRVETERIGALKERDEARQAAQFILDDLAGYRTSNRDHWEAAYPWLKERIG